MQHQQYHGAVVDQRFCFPQQTVLVMQEQLGAFRNDNFTITDTQGRPFFNLVAAGPMSLSFTQPRQLLDCFNAPVVSMEKKVPSLRGTWLIRRASDGVTVASVRRSLGFTPKIKVFMNDGDTEADFILEGDLRAKKMDVVQVQHGRGKRKIAVIKKESRFASSTAFLMSLVAPGTDKYFITIEPGVDAAFVVALAMLTDEIFHDEPN